MHDWTLPEQSAIFNSSFPTPANQDIIYGPDRTPLTAEASVAVKPATRSAAPGLLLLHEDG